MTQTMGAQRLQELVASHFTAAQCLTVPPSSVSFRYRQGRLSGARIETGVCPLDIPNEYGMRTLRAIVAGEADAKPADVSFDVQDGILQAITVRGSC